MRSTPITIRTDEALRESLQRRAKAQGKTVSALVREILHDALADRSIAARAGHTKGKLKLAVPDRDPWRRRIRERNWRS